MRSGEQIHAFGETSIAQLALLRQQLPSIDYGADLGSTAPGRGKTSNSSTMRSRKRIVWSSSRRLIGFWEWRLALADGGIECR